jgi:hypothetical protein
VEGFLADGISVGVLTINFSGLKWTNDNLAHDAGNAFLQEARIRLAEALGLPEDQVLIYRSGPNYGVVYPQVEGMPDYQARVEEVLATVAEAFSRGITFSWSMEMATAENPAGITEAQAEELARENPGLTYEVRTSEGLPQIEFTFTYSAQTEGRSGIFNQGVIFFNAGQRFSREAIVAAFGEQIYFLNRPELRAGRHGTIFEADADYLGTLSLEDRLVDYIPRENAIPSPLIEPRSGLRNAQQLEIDGGQRLQEHGQVAFAFIDGNAIGAFRSLGPLGEVMINAILEQGMPQAQEILGEHIRLYRATSGSEEFYLLGDGTVTQAQMEETLFRFIDFLASPPPGVPPIRIRVERSQLEATEMGRRYLQDFNPSSYTHTFRNGRTAVIVEVDVRQVLRGRGGLFVRGLTGTAGVGMIEASTPPSGVEPGEYYQSVFRAGRVRITDLGEIAKDLDPARVNIIMLGDVEVVIAEGVRVDAQRYAEVRAALNALPPGKHAVIVTEDGFYSMELAGGEAVRVQRVEGELQYQVVRNLGERNGETIVTEFRFDGTGNPSSVNPDLNAGRADRLPTLSQHSPSEVAGTPEAWAEPVVVDPIRLESRLLGLDPATGRPRYLSLLPERVRTYLEGLRARYGREPVTFRQVGNIVYVEPSQIGRYQFRIVLQVVENSEGQGLRIGEIEFTDTEASFPDGRAGLRGQTGPGFGGTRRLIDNLVLLSAESGRSYVYVDNPSEYHNAVFYLQEGFSIADPEAAAWYRQLESEMETAGLVLRDDMAPAEREGVIRERDEFARQRGWSARRLPLVLRVDQQSVARARTRVQAAASPIQPSDVLPRPASRGYRQEPYYYRDPQNPDGLPPPSSSTTPVSATPEPIVVGDGEYRTMNLGESRLRVMNVGGRYMVAVGREGAGLDLVWQVLPLSGDELALDGGRVLVRLENGKISFRRVDVRAALTESFSTLLQTETANLSPGMFNLRIENGQVRLATAREIPDAFLTIMPSGRIRVVIANQEYDALQEEFSRTSRDYNGRLVQPGAESLTPAAATPGASAAAPAEPTPAPIPDSEIARRQEPVAPPSSSTGAETIPADDPLLRAFTDGLQGVTLTDSAGNVLEGEARAARITELAIAAKESGFMAVDLSALVRAAVGAAPGEMQVDADKLLEFVSGREAGAHLLVAATPQEFYSIGGFRGSEGLVCVRAADGSYNFLDAEGTLLASYEMRDGYRLEQTYRIQEDTRLDREARVRRMQQIELAESLERDIAPQARQMEFRILEPLYRQLGRSEVRLSVARFLAEHPRPVAAVLGLAGNGASLGVGSLGAAWADGLMDVLGIEMPALRFLIGFAGFDLFARLPNFVLTGQASGGLSISGLGHLGVFHLASTGYQVALNLLGVPEDSILSSGWVSLPVGALASHLLFSAFQSGRGGMGYLARLVERVFPGQGAGFGVAGATALQYLGEAGVILMLNSVIGDTAGWIYSEISDEYAARLQQMRAVASTITPQAYETASLFFGQTYGAMLIDGMDHAMVALGLWDEDESLSAMYERQVQQENFNAASMAQITAQQIWVNICEVYTAYLATHPLYLEEAALRDNLRSLGYSDEEIQEKVAQYEQEYMRQLEESLYRAIADNPQLKEHIKGLLRFYNERHITNPTLELLLTFFDGTGTPIFDRMPDFLVAILGTSLADLSIPCSDGTDLEVEGIEVGAAVEDIFAEQQRMLAYEMFLRLSQGVADLRTFEDAGFVNDEGEPDFTNRFVRDGFRMFMDQNRGMIVDRALELLRRVEAGQNLYTSEELSSTAGSNLMALDRYLGLVITDGDGEYALNLYAQEGTRDTELVSTDWLSQVFSDAAQRAHSPSETDETERPSLTATVREIIADIFTADPAQMLEQIEALNLDPEAVEQVLAEMVRDGSLLRLARDRGERDTESAVEDHIFDGRYRLLYMLYSEEAPDSIPLMVLRAYLYVLETDNSGQEGANFEDYNDSWLQRGSGRPAQSYYSQFTTARTQLLAGQNVEENQLLLSSLFFKAGYLDPLSQP